MMKGQSEFYSRQVKLIGIDGQDKLRDARVLVVGAGGLGCPVLLYLAAMGVGNIGIIDNDRVSISNLHRQIIYNPNNIGEHKSQVAALFIGKQNPHIVVNFFIEKLNLLNTDRVFKDFDIIVDCSDNFETKFLIHDACYFQNKKLVQASIYQYEGNLNVFDFSNHEEIKKMACLRCLWTIEPEDGCIGTCEDVGVLGVTAGVLGSLQAVEVSKLILGNKTLENGEGLFVDLITQEYERRRWKKNKECPFCSSITTKKVMNSDQIALDNYKLSFDELNDDFTWIDIRSMDEIREFTLDHADLIYMQMEDFNILKLNPEDKYLFICQRGYRSNKAVRVLRELGYNNTFSLVDGIANFKK